MYNFSEGEQAAKRKRKQPITEWHQPLHHKEENGRHQIPMSLPPLPSTIKQSGDHNKKYSPQNPPREMVKSVSRPELVMQGLTEMCNLVKEQDPEMPSPRVISRYRTTLGGNGNCLSSPPIPPPTAFNTSYNSVTAGKTFSTTRILNVRRGTVPGFTTTTAEAIEVIEEEDEIQICQVFNQMMSNVSHQQQIMQPQRDTKVGSSNNNYLSYSRQRHNQIEEFNDDESSEEEEERQLDETQYVWKNSSFSEEHKMNKMVDKLQANFSCQCNLVSGRTVCEEEEKVIHPRTRNDKGTSTAEINEAQYSNSHTYRDGQQVFRNDINNNNVIPQNQNPFMGHCQQPIYFLQTAAANNPPGPTIIPGSKGQNPPNGPYPFPQQPAILLIASPSGTQGLGQMILQQVNPLVVNSNQTFQQYQQNHPQQSSDANEANLSARSTTQSFVSEKEHQDFQNQQNKISTSTFTLENDESYSSSSESVCSSSHNLPQREQRAITVIVNNSKGKGLFVPNIMAPEEEEPHFIVGPSPVESREMLISHSDRKIRQHPSTEPILGTRAVHQQHVNRDSQSDTQLRRDNKSFGTRNGKQAKENEQVSEVKKRNPRMKWTVRTDHPNDSLMANENDDFENYNDEEEQFKDESQNQVTPKTSSHTITIMSRKVEQMSPRISQHDPDQQDNNVIVSSVSSSVASLPPVMPKKKLKQGKKKSIKPKTVSEIEPEERIELPEAEDYNKYDQDKEFEISSFNELHFKKQPSFMRDKRGEERWESVTEKSLEDAISLIEDASSWERNVCGLRVVSFRVKFDEQGVLEKLHGIVNSIQRHIRAAGSKLAKQAICTLRDLFIALGPHFDSYLHSLAERLFSKIANTNKFIKDECEKSLEMMVKHCSQPKMIIILENVARKHKHAAIRMVACKMVTRWIKLVGSEESLADYGQLVLPLLCSNLAERTVEVRDEARNGLKLLVTEPRFDEYLRQHVNPQSIFNICDKLERVKDEVLNRPPIRKRSNVSRGFSFNKWPHL